MSEMFFETQCRTVAKVVSVLNTEYIENERQGICEHYEIL